jgi:hypothetical protein
MAIPEHRRTTWTDIQKRDDNPINAINAINAIGVKTVGRDTKTRKLAKEKGTDSFQKKMLFAARP